jgi:hypothetical protein
VSPPDPDLPPDPEEDERPRPLLGPMFWALIAFGLLCVLAGAAIALLAPRLLPVRAPPATPAHIEGASGAFANRPATGKSPLPDRSRLSSAGRAAHS